MKYCPYCGANLPDGAVSFCPECGENLPNMTEEREKKHEQPATSPDTATENRKAAPKKVKQKRKQKEPQEQDIFELYMPLINRLSRYNGQLDEDCRQYILIHIALHISEFRI